MVRAKTVESLLKLYSERTLVSNLEDFTTRFSDRFLKLPLDKNVHVAVVGLQLLRTLDQEYDSALCFALLCFALLCLVMSSLPILLLTTALARVDVIGSPTNELKLPRRSFGTFPMPRPPFAMKQHASCSPIGCSL